MSRVTVRVRHRSPPRSSATATDAGPVPARPDTTSFRPDEDASCALALLTQDGNPVSAAVRSALIRAARVVAGERRRAQAAELAADEADREEAAQVLRDMETLRAW
ncbi:MULTISPECIES: hypothetical protein [unclassified Geodermatophilus]|uniref:hypothetical protein n=1 Tax=unclassified Geodermatophilus TaxID=2637632 RepID=UPI003EEF7C78